MYKYFKQQFGTSERADRTPDSSILWLKFSHRQQTYSRVFVSHRRILWRYEIWKWVRYDVVTGGLSET